jgi:hypothetical protein
MQWVSPRHRRARGSKLARTAAAGRRRRRSSSSSIRPACRCGARRVARRGSGGGGGQHGGASRGRCQRQAVERLRQNGAVLDLAWVRVAGGRAQRLRTASVQPRLWYKRRGCASSQPRETRRAGPLKPHSQAEPGSLQARGRTPSCGGAHRNHGPVLQRDEFVLLQARRRRLARQVGRRLVQRLCWG